MCYFRIRSASDSSQSLKFKFLGDVGGSRRDEVAGQDKDIDDNAVENESDDSSDADGTDEINDDDDTDEEKKGDKSSDDADSDDDRQNDDGKRYGVDESQYDPDCLARMANLKAKLIKGHDEMADAENPELVELSAAAEVQSNSGSDTEQRSGFGDQHRIRQHAIELSFECMTLSGVLPTINVPDVE